MVDEDAFKLLDDFLFVLSVEVFSGEIVAVEDLDILLGGFGGRSVG